MSGNKGNWELTVKIKTTERKGTIVTNAFKKRNGHALWENESSGGQTKLLFVKEGKLAFDIGWVGIRMGSIHISDGRWHQVCN